MFFEIGKSNKLFFVNLEAWKAYSFVDSDHKNQKNISIAATSAVYSFNSYLALFRAYLGSPPRCPYCQGELTAKKGKIKAHHFAHLQDTCDLSQNTNVNLPLYYGFNLVLTPKQFQYLKTVTSTDYGKIKTRSFYEQERQNKRTQVSLEEKEVLQGFSHKPTPLGQAILKQLSLKEFCKTQEKLSQDKLKQLQNNLVSLEKKIEKTIEF